MRRLLALRSRVPADCIRVVAEENTAENRVSAGERYARIYEINMSRCIFCGYCELACPFDAITLGNEFEIAEYSRDDLIYTKDMLLARPWPTRPLRSPSRRPGRRVQPPLRHAECRPYKDSTEQLAMGQRMGISSGWIWFVAAGGASGPAWPSSA